MIRPLFMTLDKLAPLRSLKHSLTSVAGNTKLLVSTALLWASIEGVCAQEVAKEGPPNKKAVAEQLPEGDSAKALDAPGDGDPDPPYPEQTQELVIHHQKALKADPKKYFQQQAYTALSPKSFQLLMTLTPGFMELKPADFFQFYHQFEAHFAPQGKKASEAVWYVVRHWIGAGKWPYRDYFFEHLETIVGERPLRLFFGADSFLVLKKSSEAKAVLEYVLSQKDKLSEEDRAWLLDRVGRTFREMILTYYLQGKLPQDYEVEEHFDSLSVSVLDSAEQAQALFQAYLNYAGKPPLQRTQQRSVLKSLGDGFPELMFGQLEKLQQWEEKKDVLLGIARSTNAFRFFQEEASCKGYVALIVQHWDDISSIEKTKVFLPPAIFSNPDLAFSLLPDEQTEEEKQQLLQSVNYRQLFRENPQKAFDYLKQMENEHQQGRQIKEALRGTSSERLLEIAALADELPVIQSKLTRIAHIKISFEMKGEYFVQKPYKDLPEDIKEDLFHDILRYPASEAETMFGLADNLGDIQDESIRQILLEKLDFSKLLSEDPSRFATTLMRIENTGKRNKSLREACETNLPSDHIFQVTDRFPEDQQPVVRDQIVLAAHKKCFTEDPDTYKAIWRYHHTAAASRPPAQDEAAGKTPLSGISEERKALYKPLSPELTMTWFKTILDDVSSAPQLYSQAQFFLEVFQQPEVAAWIKQNKKEEPGMYLAILLHIRAGDIEEGKEAYARAAIAHIQEYEGIEFNSNVPDDEEDLTSFAILSRAVRNQPETFLKHIDALFQRLYQNGSELHKNVFTELCRDALGGNPEKFSSWIQRMPDSPLRKELQELSNQWAPLTQLTDINPHKDIVPLTDEAKGTVLTMVHQINPDWIPTGGFNRGLRHSALEETSLQFMIARNLYYRALATKADVIINKQTVERELQAIKKRQESLDSWQVFTHRQVLLVAHNEPHSEDWRRRTPRFGTEATCQAIQAQNPTSFARVSFQKNEGSAEIAHKAVTDTLATVKGPLTLLFDGHGGEHDGAWAFCDSGISDAYLFTAKDVVAALIQRAQNGIKAKDDTDRPILIFESCFSGTMVRNIARLMRTEAEKSGVELEDIDMPLLVSVTEFGKVGYSQLGSKYGNAFNEHVLGLGEKDHTTTIGTIIDRQYIKGMISNVTIVDLKDAVFFQLAQNEGGSPEPFLKEVHRTPVQYASRRDEADVPRQSA